LAYPEWIQSPKPTIYCSIAKVGYVLVPKPTIYCSIAKVGYVLVPTYPISKVY
jgi:hypothetical protein